MMPAETHLDAWLVERILQDNCFAEVRDIEQRMEDGLKIRDDKGRFVSYKSIRGVGSSKSH